jgi:acyl carrier protein
MEIPIDLTIRKFVERNYLYGKDVDFLSDTDSLLGLGLIDSMGILELVAFLKTTYSIDVADTELVPENLDSICQIAAYVRRKTLTPVEDGQKAGAGHAR